MGCGSSVHKESSQLVPAQEVPAQEVPAQIVPAQVVHAKSTDKGQEILGMHITAIRKFIKDRPNVISDHLTTSQINRQHVKPETIGTNAPFIQKLVGETDPETGVPFVSRATVFVSHAWRYAFYDVVVSCMEQYAVKHPDSYFWFDLFTNNQNEVMNKDFDWFCSTFRNSIKEIGQVLLVLSPWNDPKPIRRAWCLFEIHNAIEASDVKLTMDIPLNEVEELRQGLIADSKCVVQALSDIQAQQAEATSQSDLEMIFEAIEKSDGGFQHVNQQVKEQLRGWYIEQLEFLIKSEPENTELIQRSANVMEAFAFFDKALHHHENVLQINLALHGEHHISVAYAYHYIAGMLRTKGDYDKSLDYYQKSLKIKLDTFGDKAPKIATSYNNIANLYYSKEDYDKALEYHHKSFQLSRELLGDDHPNVGASYNNMAVVYSQKGDHNKALEYYCRACLIRMDNLGESHPDVAESYNNIAVVHKNKGNYDEALEYYNKSLKISLENFGESHPAVAACYSNQAVVFYIRKDYDKALDLFQKTLRIKLDTLGMHHHSVDTMLQFIAQIKYEKSKADG